MKTNQKHSFYKEYPKTCAPDDFWGQVKRTINGKPLAQEQIDMITQAIESGLNLQKSDVLLDLCCGNGALTRLLENACRNIVGVDFSEYLVQIAEKNFANEKQKYLLADVVEFCQNPTDATEYTKVLCYGSFAYLTTEQARTTLLGINQNLLNVNQIFIGNCPDKDLAEDFYKDELVSKDLLNDYDSAIGIWRSKAEFERLADDTGWDISFRKMPEQYIPSYYRYDVQLFRKDHHVIR